MASFRINGLVIFYYKIKKQYLLKNSSIIFWDVITGSAKRNLKSGGHSESVNSVCYSKDNNLIASGSTDKWFLIIFLNFFSFK